MHVSSASNRIARVDVVAQLRAELNDEAVLADADVMAPFLTDWTRRYNGTALCVVRPVDTAGVVAAVRICAGAGVAVVAQGGNTGLVGGAVPHGDAVVLSTQRLRSIGPVDGIAAQVSVGAGVTLAELQRTADVAGLRFAVDLAARDSATVGGMVATNAGGLSVLRYGTMRAQVVGTEAVLADGSVIERMRGLEKDNTGYDLAGLLCGSEGTLGVITAVRVRLVPKDRALFAFAVGLQALPAALEVLRDLRDAGIVVDTAEIVRAAGTALVAQHLNRERPVPFESPFTLLCNVVESGPAVVELLSDVFERARSRFTATELIGLSSTTATRAMWESLWAWRERHTEAIAAAGIPLKLDVTLPLGELARFVGDIDAVVREAGGDAAVVHVFGHVGDGNLHVNVLGIDPDDQDATRSVEGAVLRRVVQVGGSISAEHGIGRMKAAWLHLDRSDAELAAMRSVKRSLDPTGLFNPGVLLSAGD